MSENYNSSVPESVPEPDSEETKHDMKGAKLDAIVAVLMMALGIIAVIEAAKMPIAKTFGAAWYTSPGLMPIVFGYALIVMSAVMLIKSCVISKGICKEDVVRAIAYFKTKTFFRLLLAAFLLTVYIFVLLGNMPYMLATFLYLFVTMFLFRTETTSKHIVIMLLVSAAVAIGLGYGFKELARIPLP